MKGLSQGKKLPLYSNTYASLRTENRATLPKYSDCMWKKSPVAVTIQAHNLSAWTVVKWIYWLAYKYTDCIKAQRYLI